MTACRQEKTQHDFSSWVFELKPGVPRPIEDRLELSEKVEVPAMNPLGFCRKEVHAMKREAILHETYNIFSRSVLRIYFYKMKIGVRVKFSQFKVQSEKVLL